MNKKVLIGAVLTIGGSILCNIGMDLKWKSMKNNIGASMKKATVMGGRE